MILHCVFVKFRPDTDAADREAHLAYHRHPDHEAAGARLVQLCEGGLDGIMVFDFDTSGGPIGELVS